MSATTSTATAATTAFPSRLASVELSLIYHHLSTASAFSLLRTCQRLHSVALLPFSWRFSPPLVIRRVEDIVHLSSSRVICEGQVPIKLIWSGGVVGSNRVINGHDASAAANEKEILAQLTSLRGVRIKEFYMTERRGVNDSHLHFLIQQPYSFFITKIALGGYNHSVTQVGLNHLLTSLPNLTALSLDHINDVELEGSEDAPTAEAADKAFDSLETLENKYVEFLSILPSLKNLRALQITKWLAEELTPRSLSYISECTSLTSLFLENLECITRQDLTKFFSSAVFRGLKHLSLSYVQLTQPEAYLAFFEERKEVEEEDEKEGEEGMAQLQLNAKKTITSLDDHEEVESTAAAASSSSSPPASSSAPAPTTSFSSCSSAIRGIFDSMSELETITFVRCRDAHRLFGQIVLAPKVKRITISGLLDSWGVELPQRGDLLQLVSSIKTLESIQLIVTAAPQILENYRAQVSQVEKVIFREGANPREVHSGMSEIEF